MVIERMKKTKDGKPGCLAQALTEQIQGVEAAKGARPESAGRPTFLVPRKPKYQIPLYKGPVFGCPKSGEETAGGPITNDRGISDFIPPIRCEFKLPEGAYISQTKDNEKKKVKPNEEEPNDDVVQKEEPEKTEIKEN